MSNPELLLRPQWLTSAFGQRLVTLTPTIAAWILANLNFRNRALDKKRVAQWRRAMERGSWCDRNGTTISFDSSLQLVDGQHRLQACVESGKSFTVIAVTGCEPEQARRTADIGKMRSTGDILQLEGVEDGIIVAATVRALHRIRGNHREGTPAHSRFDSRLDMQDPGHVEAVAKREQGLMVAALAATKKIPSSWIRRGSAAALFMEFALASDADKATEFWAAVMNGANMSPDDPRLALRERLSSPAPKRAHAAGRGVALVRTFLRERIVIRGWNRWITGKPAFVRAGVFTIGLARFDYDEESPYPTILGPFDSPSEPGDDTVV